MRRDVIEGVRVPIEAVDENQRPSGATPVQIVETQTVDGDEPIYGCRRRRDGRSLSGNHDCGGEHPCCGHENFRHNHQPPTTNYQLSNYQTESYSVPFPGGHMAKYLIKASYTAEGIKGVMKDGGTKRRQAAEAAVKSTGGKLEGFYFAFGESDA